MKPLNKRIKYKHIISGRGSIWFFYELDDTHKSIEIARSEVDELALDATGEDWSHICEGGKICQYDGLLMCIQYEQNKENKRRAQEILLTNLSPELKKILSDFKPSTDEQE